MIDLWGIAILGLCVGSFLNVLIYRYPIMLTQSEKLNLFFPRSHCPYCKTSIRVYHNIPLISFILLKGRCYSCHKKISLAYPAIEFLTMIISIWIFLHYGFSWKAVAIILMALNLIILSSIDLKNYLLPDSFTLTFLWLGLLFSCFHLFISPRQAILGSMIGYLSLWSVSTAFKYVRKIDGMGHGDFKMLAMLGAWLGFPAILQTLLIAIFSALTVSLLLLVTRKIDKHQLIPFGPFLAIGGWIILVLTYPSIKG